MGEGWKIGLLGPLEIRLDGVPVPVVSGKQRALIAVLALAANEPVTVDRLITCLWGDRPPASHRNTLQNHVLRLRRALQLDTAACPIATSTIGYQLDVDPDAIDVHRFHSLVRCAQSDAMAAEPESAAELLNEALELWRGEPLVDVDSEVLHRDVVPRLVEQRLAGQEQRIDFDLQLGRHRTLVPELVELTAAHPLRERMWAQLMLSLYRCGRTADALAAYHQASRVLAEGLGLDPGAELRRLHQAVLINDPDLTITVPDAMAPPAGPPVVAPVVPRQLPAPIGHFVGRTSELRHLSARLAEASAAPLMMISTIGGTAGIGKTALAVHWGHLHADRFPDGQLYVNLRGFAPTVDPLSPGAAVRGFLTALGVPAHDIPADPDEQVALYRSRMADRRMLVILDNARDADQVRRLLPAAPGCLVLVTSRDQLGGLVALDGARPLTLDLLTRDEARDLLIRRLGAERVEGESAVVDELIEACARLPLALNIAAAHAALHPTRPLSVLMDDLRDRHRLLDTLSTGEAATDVRAVFSWSCQALPPQAKRMMRLLGLHPGPDIDLSAAASLSALDHASTRRAMEELTRAHLLVERVPGRYAMHDLLRTYAADRAHVQDSRIEQRDALRRVVDFYLHTADAAERVLAPHRSTLRLGPPAPGTRPHPLPDMPSALAWFDAEHANLLAAQRTAASHAWHEPVWQLAWLLTTFHNRRGHRHDQLAMWRVALDEVRHLPDPTPRIHAHQFLGRSYASLERPEEGIGHLGQAVALAEQQHDLDQQAQAHGGLAWAWGRRGDDRYALEHATHARNLYRALHRPVREADALNSMGWHAARLGEYDTARTHCQAALAVHRRHHNSAGTAATLYSLGHIAHHTGHYEQAIEHYQEAVTLFRGLGDTFQVVNTLDTLGHPHVALGRHEQAGAFWREALELYRQQGRNQDADRTQRQLDTLQ